MFAIIDKITNIVIDYSIPQFSFDGKLILGNNSISQLTRNDVYFVDCESKDASSTEINIGPIKKTIQSDAYVAPIVPDGLGKFEYQYIDGQFVLTENGQAQKASYRSLQIEKFKKSVENSASEKLNIFARKKGYDSIVSVISYAASQNETYRNDAIFAMERRDSTWQKIYEIFSEIDSGTRDIPNSYSDIESELPILEWPN